MNEEDRQKRIYADGINCCTCNYGHYCAIAVPLFTNYWRNAEFRKNEENARTVYLAAESKLTYYRSSGQWDSFQKQIKKQAEKDQEKSDENSVPV